MLAACGVGAILSQGQKENPSFRIGTGMNQRIRLATSADAESIARVHIESWQIAYRGQLPDTYLDQLNSQLEQRVEFWRTHISNPPADAEIWVAGDDQQVDGFVALGPARDADTQTIGEVYAIYVHPNHWNRGVGRALFAHATERLRSLGFSAAVLWVLESNSRSRRFYELAAWHLDGRTKLETRPDGVELKEVGYRKELRHD